MWFNCVLGVCCFLFSQLAIENMVLDWWINRISPHSITCFWPRATLFCAQAYCSPPQENQWQIPTDSIFCPAIGCNLKPKVCGKAQESVNCCKPFGRLLWNKRCVAFFDFSLFSRAFLYFWSSLFFPSFSFKLSIFACNKEIRKKTVLVWNTEEKQNWKQPIIQRELPGLNPRILFWWRYCDSIVFSPNLSLGPLLLALSRDFVCSPFEFSTHHGSSQCIYSLVLVYHRLLWHTRVRRSQGIVLFSRSGCFYFFPFLSSTSNRSN